MSTNRGGAVSDKGAVGLMQVLPETAERYGITPRAGRSIAERLIDPATNLLIGTRYLHDLLARFRDDLALALAAYNAGEGPSRCTTTACRRLPRRAIT
jgi:soluble lytic murein transglycosylase-like protein